MKLKDTFYHMIKEDYILQLMLSVMVEFKHQNIESIISMAHVGHEILVKPNVVKAICDYSNFFLSKGDKLSPIDLLIAA